KAREREPTTISPQKQRQTQTSNTITTMPAVLTAIGTDAQNVFEDLSGIPTSALLSPPADSPINKQLFGVSDGKALSEDGKEQVVITNPYDAMLYLAQEDPVSTFVFFLLSLFMLRWKP